MDLTVWCFSNTDDQQGLAMRYCAKHPEMANPADYQIGIAETIHNQQKVRADQQKTRVIGATHKPGQACWLLKSAGITAKN